MADGDKMQVGRGFSAARSNLRDPLVEKLIGPGKPFEIEEARIAGRTQQVFKGAPRTLAEISTRALALGSRTLVVHGDVKLSYEEAFARAGSLARALRERYGVTRGT